METIVAISNKESSPSNMTSFMFLYKLCGHYGGPSTIDHRLSSAGLNIFLRTVSYGYLWLLYRESWEPWVISDNRSFFMTELNA